jgi:undecaprenyl-diphosphatase
MTLFSRPSAIACLALVAMLAGLLGGPQNSLDMAAIHRLAIIRHSQPQLTSFVAILTQLGSAYATLGLGALVSLWLWWRGNRGRAALLAATVVVERVTMDGLKLAIGRPRPWFESLPAMPQSSSFPSGHSGNSMAVFVALALIAAPPAWRRPALALAICMSILIGLTRPFLGVPWPSDVIGGWSLGLMAVGVAIAAGKRSGVTGLETQHDVVGRHSPPIGEDQTA